MNRDRSDDVVLAVPRGRIAREVVPLLADIGIEPEPAFRDPDSRRLSFRTSVDGLSLIRVRSFDAATFVAFGGADLGVVGYDVLLEFDYDDLYLPLDLGIGRCRLAVAEPAAVASSDDPRRWSHVRVATKYPATTRRHFAARGVQAECVKLNGSLELAPQLGLCRRIVDLVDTGSTLRANGLVEVEKIADISSRLVVNRTAMKLRPRLLNALVDRFREAIDGASD